MEARHHTFDFVPHTGSGPQTQTRRFPFPKPVAHASAVLTGYEAGFVPGDHELGQLTVQVTSQIVNASTDGPEVVVSATFGLRDWSGNWDDKYAGKISIVLFAEMEGPLHPIHDLEI